MKSHLECEQRLPYEESWCIDVSCNYKTTG